jgi:hypothetical protein
MGWRETRAPVPQRVKLCSSVETMKTGVKFESCTVLPRQSTGKPPTRRATQQSSSMHSSPAVRNQPVRRGVRQNRHCWGPPRIRVPGGAGGRPSAYVPKTKQTQSAAGQCAPVRSSPCRAPGSSGDAPRGPRPGKFWKKITQPRSRHHAAPPARARRSGSPTSAGPRARPAQRGRRRARARQGEQSAPQKQPARRGTACAGGRAGRQAGD